MKKEKAPTAQTYKVEKLDERKILSTKKSSFDFRFSFAKEPKGNSNIKRFIDIHKKDKAWVPPVTKYNFTADQREKFLSSSPPQLRRKR